MKGLFPTLLALLAFAGTHALISAGVAGRPELRLLPDSIEAGKFAWFRDHADEIDLVYVGTSRVFRGFDPAVFDARMSELGRPLRSYNFGLIGMSHLEQRFVVEWVLAQRGERLRWLVVEPTEREYVLTRSNLLTLRDVHWHTPRGVRRAIAAAWSSGPGLAHGLALTRAHLLQGLHRGCNVGVGAGLLTRAFAPPPPPPELPAGFEGRDRRWNLGRFLAGAQPEGEGEGESEAQAEVDPAPDAEPVFPRATYAALTALVRAAGIEPLYAIPPTSMPLALFKEAADRGELPNLHVFPLRTFPEILADQGAFFYDPGHLNLHGAALFSRRLAERLAPLVASAR